MGPDEAFGWMADLRNFADWDPGVKNVSQSEGDGAGMGSAFDVTVKGFTGDMVLTYVTTEFDEQADEHGVRSMTARAESSSLTSVDVITVRPAQEKDGELDDGASAGSVVTYDAELTLNGALGIADPMFQLTFNKVGEAAADGLVEALDGERLDDNEMSALAAIFDDVLEFPVVTSFTRIGIQARRRLSDWRDLNTYDLSGRVMVVTGGTSGLGRAAVEQLARCGATVVLTGRKAARNEEAVAELLAATGSSSISQIAADMGDLSQVRALADEILTRHDRLDVLMHNAGALPEKRTTSAQGIESTVASQLVGPFLLTSLLLDRLTQTGDARVITMSSGGMYTSGLSIGGLQMLDDSFNGAEQYARAKRAQVTLNEMWAERHAESGVTFHALHPGWADTPGVAESLPLFGRVVGPLLRTPAEGADTMVWLAADDRPLESNGGFWLDRQIRSIHKLPTTRSTDTPERRERLWDWVSEAITS